ncbi:winged helix DNA-binding domain-containing protein [Nocardioides mangrovi]|uniref:Winged helix DNA-binding domain-containing protein n=1 Tax=Nocardioides mangrovi TaxID=2874580 RepID=A0ABS7UK43_9ACTN|nr:winged helix DNA-binding domain-containing protein [Nocardioides mangrovi]MBZ5741051.1 winged helix DNA-binding domain-containing protein [Nocardioides mangrovi]
MILTHRRLNRTLLRRQHLLERSDLTAADLVEHLVGVQAQEVLPPYVGLHARLRSFDPYDVARGLEDRSLVRLLTLRGTIHLHTAADALALRPWTQPALDKVLRHHAPVDRLALEAAVDEALADGAVTQRELSTALAEQLPDVPASDLGVLARGVVPLVQLPPRGGWHAPGGISYDHLGRWLGEEPAAPDLPELVRRYLRAFGPAGAADMTAWSGVTRLGPVLAGMEDLTRHEDERGRTLYDVADGVLEDEDAPAPVRLLGTYDNVWLSHADRDRVTAPDKRRHWMGANGGVAMVVLVDGMLEGLWRVVDDRVEIVELLRDLTPAERRELDAEVERTDALLGS